VDPPVDQQLLDAAVAIASAAAATTLRWFRSDDLEVQRKGDGTPVTEADRAAEAHVRAAVAEGFPDDGVLGEEEAEHLGTSGQRWIVDPIDGTKAFTRGVPLYSTLLAVEDEHGLAAGVVVLPALGEIVWAGRGRGCWHDGRRAAVSTTTDVGEALLTTSGYTHWPEPMLLGARRSGMQLRTWGDGYGYALVATGRADVMVDPEAEPYDLAPMPLLLAEAGGRFSDLDGGEGYGGGSGLATNGLLHDEVLAVLTTNPTS
jgi:histidinol-phosphatase